LQKKDMFDKLMGQLGPMKDAMDQAKKKLETISVKGEADGGAVVAYVNGNRKVTDIKISQELMDEGDKEAIEELLQVALNKALESANNVNEMEMASAARGMMPGMF
jgi:DNA-binding YbaB/EbfC family protein